MPKEVLDQYLGLQGEERLKLQFILQSAPLLKGLKMSCILVVEENYLEMIHNELRDTEIRIQFLCQKNGKSTILLYREELLELYLNQTHIRDFLELYGYDHLGESTAFSLSEVLEVLKKRVSFFCEKEGTFPHEIGVFLGYPMEDVVGFIENAGENYLVNGYWKVYSDVREAKKRFRSYDEAKLAASKEMFAGRTIKEITA